jgi:hypothetical protein
MIPAIQIPGGTVTSIVDILNGAINAILPQVLAFMSTLGLPPV